MGPFEYNKWKGVATYLGNWDEKNNWWQFDIGDGDKAWFAQEDILAKVED